MFVVICYNQEGYELIERVIGPYKTREEAENSVKGWPVYHNGEYCGGNWHCFPEVESEK